MQALVACHLCFDLSQEITTPVLQGVRLMAAEGTYKAYFRGNGANVVKNVPETALKLTCNDRIKAMIASDGHTVTLGRSHSFLPYREPAWSCIMRA